MNANTNDQQGGLDTKASSAILAAEAREAADLWVEVQATHGSPRARDEAKRRADLYGQLAEVFDFIGEQEDEYHRFDGDRYTPIDWNAPR